MVEALRCRPLPASPESTVAALQNPPGAWAAGRPPAGTVSWKASAGAGHRWFHQPPSQFVAPCFLPGCDLLQSTRGWVPDRGKCPWCAGLRAGQEQGKWSTKKRLFPVLGTQKREAHTTGLPPTLQTFCDLLSHG